jgi:hypothetical protein
MAPSATVRTVRNATTSTCWRCRPTVRELSATVRAAAVPLFVELNVNGEAGAVAGAGCGSAGQSIAGAIGAAHHDKPIAFGVIRTEIQVEHDAFGAQRRAQASKPPAELDRGGP